MKNAIREFDCAGCGVRVVKSCTKTVRFCSPSCYHKHGKAGRKKTGKDIDCAVCGVRFYIPANRIGIAVTCSVACANIHQGRNKVSLVCSVCGNTFVRSQCFSGQQFCSISCRNNSESFKAHTLRIGAEQNMRKTPNRLEALGYSILDASGVEYIRQFSVSGKFTVDAFVPSIGVVIQFDGDYWHGKPDLYPCPDHRQRKRMALDISQDAYLRKIGYSVARFWESDFTDLVAVRHRMLSCIGATCSAANNDC